MAARVVDVGVRACWTRAVCAHAKARTQADTQTQMHAQARAHARIASGAARLHEPDALQAHLVELALRRAAEHLAVPSRA